MKSNVRREQQAELARRHTLGAGVLLVAMTAAAYAPVCTAGFIWDDDNYIVNNVALRSPSGLARIWLDTSTERQYYPLVHTMFWFEYQLWGAAPLGYHLVNLALHAVAALLLWRLLLRLKIPGAWLAAALFALHPVMVESVAWVSERKNTLSLTLALAALHCYLRFRPLDLQATAARGTDEEIVDEKSITPVVAVGSGPSAVVRSPRLGWYAAALVAFAGALAAKTVVASLPAVLLVIIWFKRGRIMPRDLLPLAPLFALGLVFGLLTAELERVNVGAVGDEWQLTSVERALIAGRAVWFYASKLAVPYSLAFFYPHFDVDPRVWWQYLFPIAAVAVPIGLFAARKRIGRGPAAAALVFGGVLLPALGFFDVYPFRYSFVADHFQYHASIALIVLAAAGTSLAAAQMSWRMRGRVRFTGAVLLAVLACVTATRVRVFDNPETLYWDTIVKNPTGPAAYENLGVYLESQGRYNDATAVLVQALKLHPCEMGESNLGHVMLKIAERNKFPASVLDKATEHFRKALEYDPRSFAAGRGLALSLLYARRYDEAIDQFVQTLAMHPGNAQAHIELGDLLAKRRRFAAAAEQFDQAVRLMPSNVEAWNSLGILSGEIGDTDRAIECFEEALRQQPDAEQPKANLETARKLKISAEAAR